MPPEIKHVRELARQYTESAVAALAEVMGGDSAAAKVAAANALLDRGWGKPEQAIIGPGENGEHLFSEIVRRIVK